MQYLLYYVVCFKVWGTTRELFMNNVVDATLTNCRVFMWQYAHDVEVGSTCYKKANGIPSPVGIDINSS
jgi:hypothetical protein